MKLKASLFSQRNSQWGSELLGFNTNSKYTIHNYGCLITCFGMYINKNPHEVNDVLKANGGFTAGSGNFVWSKSAVFGMEQTYVSPKYTGPVSLQGLAKVKELLDQHFPLICEIDFNPVTDGEEMHFVLLTGYENESIYACDPWTGEYINLDLYGGPARAIVQFRVYNKTLEEEVGGQPTIIQQSDNWIALITTCSLPNSKDGAIAEVKRRTELADKVEEKDREIELKNTQLEQIETKLDELEMENAKHIGDIEAMGERLKENNTKFSALQDEINELKKIKPITEYSARELLAKLLEKLF